MASVDSVATTWPTILRRLSWSGVSVAGLVLVCLLALCIGQFPVSGPRALAIIGNALVNPGALTGTIEERIVLLVRLPRVVLAVLAGAGLAVCGCALQSVFRNPLVAPQILGVSPGAAFGGALAIMLGVSGIALLGLSFACGLAALAIVGWVARIDGRTEPITVLLGGLVVGALFSALVSLIQFVADPNGSLPAIVYWLMGSFASATWERVALAAPGLLLGTAVLFKLRFRLNLLSLGDKEARSLGAKPDRERWLVFVFVTVVVASSVAVSGVIGWIGLIVPQIARLLVGPDQRIALPVAGLAGAMFMVMTDTLARSMSAAEIPLGVLTAIAGAPVFAVLLRRHYRERRT